MSLYKIEPLTCNHIEETQLFLSTQLNHFFHYNYSLTNAKDDIFLLENKYISPNRNNFWLAFDKQNNIIGSIAASIYDDRIDLLKGHYNLDITAEVGRCYVHPDHRRKGIGHQLLSLAENFCIDKDFSIIYLHTHHFLPGGYNFWKKNHFQTTIDEGGLQQIIHMEKKL